MATGSPALGWPGRANRSTEYPGGQDDGKKTAVIAFVAGEDRPVTCLMIHRFSFPDLWTSLSELVRKGSPFSDFDESWCRSTSGVHRYGLVELLKLQGVMMDY